MWKLRMTFRKKIKTEIKIDVKIKTERGGEDEYASNMRCNAKKYKWLLKKNQELWRRIKDLKTECEEKKA